MKRVVRLVQTYLSVKKLELEMRPFTDDDQTMDVRGQSMMSASSAVPMTSSLPAEAAADDETVVRYDAHVTSPADAETEAARATATKKTTRKKRKSSRKSEMREAGEQQLATDQVGKGFSRSVLVT